MPLLQLPTSGALAQILSATQACAAARLTGTVKALQYLLASTKIPTIAA
jgi:hypothetical protein